MSEEQELQEPKTKRIDADSEEETGSFLDKLPRPTFGKRIFGFIHDVKTEMRKTTWPDSSAVWSTTVVVVIAVIFFGFYLWGADVLIKLGFDYLEKIVK